MLRLVETEGIEYSTKVRRIRLIRIRLFLAERVYKGVELSGASKRKTALPHSLPPLLASQRCFVRT
jgi:hypothetical protein